MFEPTKTSFPNQPLLSTTLTVVILLTALAFDTLLADDDKSMTRIELDPSLPLRRVLEFEGNARFARVLRAQAACVEHSTELNDAPSKSLPESLSPTTAMLWELDAAEKLNEYLSLPRDQESKDTVNTSSQSTTPRAQQRHSSGRVGIPYDRIANDLPLITQLHNRIVNVASLVEQSTHAQTQAKIAFYRGNTRSVQRFFEFQIMRALQGRKEAKAQQFALNRLVVSQLKRLAANERQLRSDSVAAYETAFIQWQQATRDNGLPDSEIAGLREQGFTQRQIESATKRMLSTDPRKAAAIYSALKATLVAQTQQIVFHRSASPGVEYWNRVGQIAARCLKDLESTAISLSFDDKKENLVEWYVVAAGGDTKGLLNVPHQRSKADCHVFPGVYDVYVLVSKLSSQNRFPAAVRVAMNLRVLSGETRKIRVNHAATIDQLKQSEQRVTPKEELGQVRLQSKNGISLPTSWFAVKRGEVVHSVKSHEGTNDQAWMSIPSGKYDFYWLSDAAKSPSLLAEEVAVTPGNHATITVDSGIRFEPADWIYWPAEGGSNWSAVSKGDLPTKSITRCGTSNDAPLIPGHYDVYWQRTKKHKPMLLASDLHVTNGQLVKVPATSGVELRWENWVHPPGKNGWWGVVPANSKELKPINYRPDAGKLLVPPGRYDIVWKHSDHPKALVVHRNLEILPRHVTQFKLTTGIVLSISDWVPSFDSHGWWGVVPSGASSESLMSWCSHNRPLPLTPGSYDVYWKQSYSQPPVIIAKAIKLERGRVSKVAVDTGIQIDVAGWVPTRDPQHGWWGVIETDGDPNKVERWTRKSRFLVMIPGRYDVFWKPTYSNPPVLVAKSVNVGASQLVDLPIKTGLRLHCAAWLPKRDRRHGWWGIVPTGGDASKAKRWTRTKDTVLALAGKYDVYWKQGYSFRPLRIAEGVTVGTEELAVVFANSGLQLEFATKPPELNKQNGWWGVVRSDSKKLSPLHWTRQWTEPLLLPPGKYNVIWKKEYNFTTKTIASAEVREGKLTRVLVRPVDSK